MCDARRPARRAASPRRADRTDRVLGEHPDPTPAGDSVARPRTREWQGRGFDPRRGNSSTRASGQSSSQLPVDDGARRALRNGGLGPHGDRARGVARHSRQRKLHAPSRSRARPPLRPRGSHLVARVRRDGRDDPHRARDASRCRLRAHVIRRDPSRHPRRARRAPGVRAPLLRVSAHIPRLARSTRPRPSPPRRALRGPSPRRAPPSVALSPIRHGPPSARYPDFARPRPGLERPSHPDPRRILSDHSHSSPTIIPDVPALTAARPRPPPPAPRRHPRLKPPGALRRRRSQGRLPQARSSAFSPPVRSTSAAISEPSRTGWAWEEFDAFYCVVDLHAITPGDRRGCARAPAPPPPSASPPVSTRQVQRRPSRTSARTASCVGC